MADAAPIRDVKPLRIEVVTDTFVPDINGVAMTLGRLTAGLRQLGHHVEIVRSGRAEGSWETAIQSLPLPGYWEIKVATPWPGQLRRRWKQQRPDVVFVAIETFLGFGALLTARKMRIPVIGGFQTNFRDYLLNYGAHRTAAIVWWYQKWFHERLHLTLVPSPDTHAKLTTAGFQRLKVLGRGVDTEMFSPARRSAEFRKTCRIDGDAPLAIVVGRVSSEKNIELAIRAFERMKQQEPALACVVIGDGPARERLEREHPWVRFTGYLTGEALAEAYASADLMLFPSETETFGNVLLEGMASGLAVLAYDYAAAGWHGRDGDNLLKVTKGDEAAFLAAAQTLLDPSRRRTLGAAARASAESLSWPAVVAELEKIFLSAAASSEGPCSI